MQNNTVGKCWTPNSGKYNVGCTVESSTDYGWVAVIDSEIGETSVDQMSDVICEH